MTGSRSGATVCRGAASDRIVCRTCTHRPRNWALNFLAFRPYVQIMRVVWVMDRTCAPSVSQRRLICRLNGSRPPRKPPCVTFLAGESFTAPCFKPRGQEVTDAMHRARYRSEQALAGLLPAGRFADLVTAASASPSHRSRLVPPVESRGRRLRESIINGKENAYRRDPCGRNPRGRRGRNQGRGI